MCYPPPRGRLPTCYSPVRHCTHRPKPAFSFDLHVLGTLPAFVLSQDQTLQFNLLEGGKPPYRSKKKTKRHHKLPSPLFSSQRPKTKPHQAYVFSQFFDYRYLRFLCQGKNHRTHHFSFPPALLSFPSLILPIHPISPLRAPRSGTFLRISLCTGNVKENMKSISRVMVDPPADTVHGRGPIERMPFNCTFCAAQRRPTCPEKFDVASLFRHQVLDLHHCLS